MQYYCRLSLPVNRNSEGRIHTDRAETESNVAEKGRPALLSSPLIHILVAEEYAHERVQLEHSSHPLAQGQVKGEISQTAGADKM
jgi:hypothetical protein